MNTKKFQMNIFVTLLFIIAGLGLLDAQIPREVTFFVMYFLPLGIGAYFLSNRLTIVLAAFTILTWFASDFLTSGQYSNISVFLWNLGVRGFVFVALALTIHRFRMIAEQYRIKIGELEQKLSTVSTLDGSHLVCDTCGRLSVENGQWLTPLTFIQEKSHSSLHSCICPDCLTKTKQIQPDSGRDLSAT